MGKVLGPMLLHLVRHGIAVDRDDPRFPEDAERPLTSKGRRRTRRSASGIRAVATRPERVFASPYVRAQQTAAILVETLRVSEPLVTTQALVPEADPEQLLGELGPYGEETVLCVGHAPHLDRLLARVLGVSATVSTLKKASLATLEIAPAPEAGLAGRGQLRGFYPPAVLRAFAKLA